jgi:hypothetical protein
MYALGVQGAGVGRLLACGDCYIVVLEFRLVWLEVCCSVALINCLDCAGGCSHQACDCAAAGVSLLLLLLLLRWQPWELRIVVSMFQQLLLLLELAVGST